MKQGFELRRLVLAFAVATLAAVACNKRNDNAYDTTSASGTVALPSDSAAAPPGGGATDLPTTEAGVIELLKAVDTSEVEAGQLARTRAANAKVKGFAREMVTEHSADLKKLGRMRVGRDSATTPEVSPMVTTLQSKHQQSMSRLQGLSGAEFDRAYMEEMVNGHQQVLDLLHQLQSSSQSAQWSSADISKAGSLAQQLTREVSTVERHLERARTIQSSLSGSDTTRTKQ